VDVVFVVGEAGPLDQPGPRVEFEVELAELGLERRVGQVGQDLGVAHGRLGVAVDQVELDLQPGRGPFGVEAEVVEHQREDVQAAAYLLPVPDPVLAREPERHHILAHGASPPAQPWTFHVRSAGRPKARDKENSYHPS
jgi:hypothetical protein